MKNTDIAKIRQLLTEIHDTVLPCIHTSYSGNFQEFSKKIEQARWNCSEKIRQALALLPCETCGGTGEIGGDFSKSNCSDCQSQYQISNETSDTDVDSASKYCEKHGVFYGVGQSCPVCQEYPS